MHKLFITVLLTMAAASSAAQTDPTHIVWRQEEVTHQHSDLVVPNLIDGITTTTCRTLIDDIVVHQCGIVEQLQGDSAIGGSFVDIAQHLGRKKCHNGAQLLAATLQKIVNNRIGQRYPRSQNAFKHMFEIVQLFGNTISDAVIYLCLIHRNANLFVFLEIAAQRYIFFCTLANFSGTKFFARVHIIYINEAIYCQI